MQFETVHLISEQTGETFTGRRIVCDECGAGAFALVLMGDEKHTHLQCVECGMWYCGNHHNAAGH